MQNINFNWLVKMAWRDSRRNRSRLLLFISSIILGIAALVAINSFSENLQNNIALEAKSLLGADMQIEANRLMPDSIQSKLLAESVDQSVLVNFLSMALFPETGDTRLARIVALEGNFPYYGKFNTEPASAAADFRNAKQALVDKTMMMQFGLKSGGLVKIGEVTFEIAGQLNSAPGSAGIFSFAAPSVYIPRKYLEATDLVKMGSRIEYQNYFKFEDDFDVAAFEEKIDPMVRESSGRIETVASRQENIGEAFGNMSRFLNLIGFIALLLGCIGVASAVHIYVKDKLSTVAILRCLGVSGRQAFQIYLLQIMIMGFIGSIVGAVLGSVLQLAIPFVLKDFLPLENITSSISGTAIVQGIVTGLGIALLFALLPLLSIRKTSPLRTLRASFDQVDTDRDYLKWLVYAGIFLFIGGFTWFQTRSLESTFYFAISIIVAFLLLSGLARLIMFLVKKFFPTEQSYVVRQGIANLFRPNNQTLILIVSIGLGTALISTLFFTQDLLLQQVEMSSIDDQPNIILFDIQKEQKDGVTELVRKNNMPLIQEVPIVTLRVNEIDGVDKKEYLQDTTSKVREWVYNREYRVTYRDTLLDTETIVEGEWHGDKEKRIDIPYISISDRVARAMKAKIGTRIIFNVQGVDIETEVSSIREVDFNRVQTNFFVVFPNGILEKAPQFNVIVSRVETPEMSAAFQRDLVKQFPNVSAIDLTQILKSVETILNKVSFAIRFMALFSILTGLVVLIGSVVLSKYQRIKESVLLRTLGASRRQILWINTVEYLLLGSLAVLTGIALSMIGSWLLARYTFQIPFQLNLLPALWLMLSIVTLTVLIGLFNSREIISKPPLEVLRSEV